ncbi:MAG: universal stress protein [Pikeienuella sp.]|uniref:universal stress protein n=1 Tax=Pikeienuella sp. TaxID=2831957 RepID=UPI00391AA9BA
MFSRIMVPVDLGHKDRLRRALDAAGKLAKAEGAEIVFVGVTGTAPGAVARSPEAYRERLDAFAAEESGALGVPASADAVIAHDPAVDLGAALVEEIPRLGADAVVMASHLPGLAEHVFASNAGYVASHAPVSVFVVR